MTVQDNKIRTDAGLGRKSRRSRFRKRITQIPISVRKNYRLFRNPEFWQMLPLLLACRLQERNFAEERTKIFVGTHHKAMTTYFKPVLRILSFGLGTRFEEISKEIPQPETRVFLSMHSRTPLSEIGPYRGVHVMRDPRDVIVSSYYYHLWTNELWAHVPDENGLSYQDKLRSVDKKDGLFMTIRHFIYFNRETLENWNLDDPDILEVSYDALMGENRDKQYSEIFTFLGLTDRAHELGVRLMRLFEAGNRSKVPAGRTNERAHIRSGRSGQWKDELEPEHVAFIEREFGHILDKFGYPRASPELER
ncbi:sulfotransferase domain-containing protein [Ruegeria sediminis]|uniref:Sulfotransferase domain-containing protein n=1 Tax=Ruegeria sediminis TaxID=2583820 RepID=A0ABY2WWX8_9RHOB|nr:sulfotransferase domain-containing protein [Ruegeria sediminis]TMV07010.1 sulfotransferase domain-containing protein [Ruegeria sediminis]